jgi:dTMP kinase
VTARGLFITFEGGDGCGKTTQAEATRQFIERLGHDVLRTREPGGTDLGLEIRQLLLHSPIAINPRAEALLFAADRAQNIHTQVRPALAAGTNVVQDRYWDSSVAYQGAGRALDPREVLNLSLWATDTFYPDLTVLLDLDPALAAARVAAGGKLDKLEGERDEFRTRLRDGFLAIAEREPDRFLILDAELPADELTAAIGERIVELLKART